MGVVSATSGVSYSRKSAFSTGSSAPGLSIPPALVWARTTVLAFGEQLVRCWPWALLPRLRGIWREWIKLSEPGHACSVGSSGSSDYSWLMAMVPVAVSLPPGLQWCDLGYLLLRQYPLVFVCSLSQILQASCGFCELLDHFPIIFFLLNRINFRCQKPRPLIATASVPPRLRKPNSSA